MFIKKIIGLFFKHKIRPLEMSFLIGIKECIDIEYHDNYAQQIEEINYIKRLIDDTEILFYHKEKGKVGFSKNLKISNLEKESLVSTIKIVDVKEKEYLIKVWFVNGFIFSFESNRSLKQLEEDMIKSIEYQCK